MAKASPSASQFLLSLMPQGLRSAYETLEGLTYPIDDQASLADSISGDKLGLLGAFQAADFPMASSLNAFEKLRDRLPLPFLPLPTPDPETPDDRPERPSVADVYEETFGAACGRKALEAYLAARRSMPELAAVVAGHWEGKRCIDELAELLRDFPPPPRPIWEP